MLVSQEAFISGILNMPPANIVPYRSSFNMLFKNIDGAMAQHISHSNGTDLTDYFVNDDVQLNVLRGATEPDMKATPRKGTLLTQTLTFQMTLLLGCRMTH